jgi:hypothetical protein
VLTSTGRPSAGFTWDDPARTESVEDVLNGEGVRFNDGAADPAQRLRADALVAFASDD